MPSPKLTAVIDYHPDEAEMADDGPGWCAHRVRYEFPLTEEFKTWMKFDGEPLKQVTFAAFIEEHAAELASPLQSEVNEFEALFREKFATPTEMIDLSRGMEVLVGQKFKRSERLANGDRVMEFSTETMDAKGAPLVVPGIFILSIKAFVDGEVLRIPARLRYRASGGDLVWFYQLYRAEHFLRAAVQGDLKTAAEKTGLPAFEGAWEQA